MEITKERIIGIILLSVCAIISILWMVEINIPVPAFVFWVLLALGIVFILPGRKKKQKQVE